MLSLLKSIKKRDPAANNYLEIIFFYPGLHALLIYKLANIFWKLKLTFFAKTISSQVKSQISQLLSKCLIEGYPQNTSV